MGNAVARLGDSSTHGGSITSAAAKSKCEGAYIARVGDSFLCPIHGAQTITSGSPRFTCEGANVARTGSAISCGATVIGGAAKTVCG